MTPATELARLFPEIQRPEPLAPIDPIDADEAVNGVCAQGDDECAI